MRPSGNTPPIQAGIYCRMSLASMGDTTKVDDQERICRELATRLGWPVTEVYLDNNVSAWQPNRKRKHWDRMVADAEAGRINALIVYHGDRLIRRPEDLYELLKWARTRGFKLASPTGQRDLGNPDDEYILWIEAAGFNRSSADSSRRKISQYERWWREGRVRTGGRGGRSFGFTTDGLRHLPPQCCVVATREELFEADIVREIARRLLAGEGTISIARDLAARGVVNASGHPFTADTLRKMMSRERYAGLMPDGKTRAAWEPIVDRETWELVQAILAMKRGRFAYITNARKYLLSGIAGCGACGKPLQIRSPKSRDARHYGCIQPGCRKVFRSMELLDAYVSRRTVNLLSHPLNPAPRELAAVGLATQFAALEEQRAETAKMAADPDHPHLHILLARLDALDERLAGLRQLAEGDARVRLMETHAGITSSEFAALPLATRRALVSACYRVVVLPASKRGPGFRTEDVRLEPRA